MSGTSGCGYEFELLGVKQNTCSHLDRNLLGFNCLKYSQVLIENEKTGHPVRLKQCRSDAARLADQQTMKKVKAK